MPQLQIKVPTLRRWGKKMAVVIDKPFLDAMGKMNRVPDISNCDIVWVIVNFRDNHLGSKVEIEIADTIFTTLEDSVTALTAGTPTTLTDFEARLRKKARPSQGDWPLMPS